MIEAPDFVEYKYCQAYYRCPECHPGTEAPYKVYSFCLKHYEVYFEHECNEVRIILKKRTIGE